MEWTVTGPIIAWRGPAPYLFVAMSKRTSADVKTLARELIYWGQVPVVATLGATEFATAMWPRDGRYLVPIKVAVQRAERVGLGDRVTLRVRLAAR